MYKINEADWSELASKKIFFGHQSVGNNIVDGIKLLKGGTDSTGFNIIETRDTSDFIAPLFAHSRLGKNHDPESKIKDFVKLLESGLGNSLDIAFMKLCYVDLNKETDIPELFNYYQSSLNRLASEFPELRFIHCTVPLTIRPQGLKGVALVMLKMDGNIQRHRYNELLRNSYDKNEIYDIADIESRYDDSSQNLYNNKIPGLINEYTSDNEGHLNEKGEKILAYHLLKMLLTFK